MGGLILPKIPKVPKGFALSKNNKENPQSNGLRFSLHPLFFVCGFYYALTGRILIFLIYTICALMHELGHSFVANDRGYKLNKITLMPFGAVVSGDLDNLKAKDEIKIALAGPFLNLFVGVFFVALWWIFPETYAYTDIVAEANFSMAIINFIPAYPLDGGRVLCAIISLYKDRKTALKICRIIGGVMAGVLIALFIYSCFTSVNLSILLFALFILSGLFVKNTGYIRAIEFPSALSLKRGVPYKKQALDKSATVKRLYDILDPEAVNEIVIFDNDIPIATLSQQTINSIIATKDFYTPIINHIAKTE